MGATSWWKGTAIGDTNQVVLTLTYISPISYFQLLIGMIDPSGLSQYPGWPLRNLLALLSHQGGAGKVGLVCGEPGSPSKLHPTASFSYLSMMHDVASEDLVLSRKCSSGSGGHLRQHCHYPDHTRLRSRHWWVEFCKGREDLAG